MVRLANQLGGRPGKAVLRLIALSDPLFVDGHMLHALSFGHKVAIHKMDQAIAAFDDGR